MGSQMSMTVMFDHWEDANHRSFLGVIATQSNGKRFLLDLRDVSLKGHFADVSVKELVEILQDLPKRAINSIVSDSASACKKAREDFVNITQFKHVIHHRCLAHLMNLIGTKVSSNNVPISATIKQAMKATSIISNSIYWQNYLKSLSISRPQTACPVRWYSTVTMISALTDLESVILEKIVPGVDETKSEILSSLDWAHLREILGILKPLCECIGQVERQDISLGEAIKCILDYAKQLFNDGTANIEEESRTFPTPVMVAARKAFLFYFNENKLGRDELGLYIAAYTLDRRYKLDFLTEDAIELAFEAISRISIKSGATVEQIQKSLFLEFNHYRTFEPPFTASNEIPISWWSERASTSPLSCIGLRIANLKASSANIERTFSTLKYIQGDYRLNLGRETLLHSARIKIAIKDAIHDLVTVDDDFLCPQWRISV